jgi:hypothetical protein
MASYRSSIPNMPTRAFFSDRLIHEYFMEVSAASPSLRQLSPDTISEIAEGEIAWLRTFKVTALGMISLLVVDNGIAAKVKPGTQYSSWLAAGLFSLLIVGLVLLVIYPFRARSNDVAATWLFDYVVLLERNADAWGAPRLKNEMTRQIKKLANVVERIPYQYHHLAPEVRRELLAASRKKAQAVRELQHWVLTPGPFTFTDLIHRFTIDLDLIASGQWRELPELEYQYRPARWVIAVLWLLALLVLSAEIIGVVLIPKYLPALASVTPVIASVLGTGAVLLFIRAGMPINLISISTSIGSRLDK